jgi:hypothetical protein
MKTKIRGNFGKKGQVFAHSRIKIEWVVLQALLRIIGCQYSRLIFGKLCHTSAIEAKKAAPRSFVDWHQEQQPGMQNGEQEQHFPGHDGKCCNRSCHDMGTLRAGTHFNVRTELGTLPQFEMSNLGSGERVSQR